MSQESLPKVYEPKEVEEKWMAAWESANLFQANHDSGKDSFTIVIPPPNVTGVLHMGHALNNTLQDILCRYKRMQGFEVLWVPGTDHAGIATQNVVERKLAAEDKSRHDVGREAFIEEVWKWKEKHGGHIIHQLKRLGASCDWSRERFTMDEGLSKAVREAFVTLHERDLIERDLYLINWCPRCLTALSDLEVEHEEQKGNLWHFKYPFAAGPVTSGSFEPPADGIVVATTRPETILGDTAVAVHPDDERYKHLIGKKVLLPLVEREIPIIADHRVDREFGSGAVKITPAHDFNDYQMGKDHNLEMINVLTDDAHMNENAIHFKGEDRYQCRSMIVTELEEKGFLVDIEENPMSVGHCYRCKTVVEPYLSLQWFVRTETLAADALKAVHDGHTTFHPTHWTKTYEQWMENIQDWCISRQIWWGHRIPAWYCPQAASASVWVDSPHITSLKSEVATKCQPIVSREVPTKCPNKECGSTELIQDPDVLDTWFSSGLWPFSTLGWPEQTPELDKFYPTKTLVTAFDIIFFWVARMMMMGIALQPKQDDDIKERIPFEDVYIHAIVRDAEGKKMSKSKGNVIDPLEIMDKFGTDAFRFTLAALAAQGRDIKLSEDIIAGYRNFANKIWNAARFSLMKLDGYREAQDGDIQNPGPYDYWIRYQLDQTFQTVKQALDRYEFNVAAKAIYHFFWHDFCDWYIEFSKIELEKLTLYEVLLDSMRLLHPFMPFITEEIWHVVTGRSESDAIMKAADEFFKKETLLRDSERHIAAQDNSIVNDLVIPIIDQIRSIKGETGVSPAKTIEATVFVKNKDKSHIEREKTSIETIARVTLTITNQLPSLKNMAHGIINESLQVLIPLEGVIDLAVEKQRLEKELGKIAGEITRIEKKLSNQDFIARAPADVVAGDKARLADLQAKQSRLKTTHDNLI